MIEEQRQFAEQFLGNSIGFFQIAGSTLEWSAPEDLSASGQGRIGKHDRLYPSVAQKAYSGSTPLRNSTRSICISSPGAVSKRTTEVALEIRTGGEVVALPQRTAA